LALGLLQRLKDGFDAIPGSGVEASWVGWLYKTRGTCLVEIETEDGVVGWGECYGPSAVAKAFIETQLAARVIGRDPFDVEVIWEDLYNRIKDYGPKGMSIAAISGNRYRALGYYWKALR
jgi:L-alanine-DL-glutamate epimerase-like enolase superfamily enzyme